MNLLLCTAYEPFQIASIVVLQVELMINIILFFLVHVFLFEEEMAP